MIRFRSASVVAPGPAGERTILHPTTLDLPERFVSVIGANGSGKSTLARLINGLIMPSTGEVTVAADAEQYSTSRHAAKARRMVGFLFTNPDAQLIMPTVIEDVSLSLRRTHRDRATRHAEAARVLNRLGVGDLADRSVHELSGGQKQLVALAAVLAASPTIIVADEPTTLLDLHNTHLVGRTLMSLPQQLVLVTHDLDLAARADRTLVIEDGRVVYDGAPSEAIDHYRERAMQA